MKLRLGAGLALALAIISVGCQKPCPPMPTRRPPPFEPLDETLSEAARQNFRRSLQIRTPILSHGSRALKRVALSFDDGPHPGLTEPLLDVLDKLHVHATFFVVGKMAAQAPYLIQEEVRRGHEVGNHTYDHVHVTYLTDPEIAREVLSTNDVIRRYTGKPAVLFRPPGGRLSWGAYRALRACGMTTVLWTDDPRDYLNPGAPNPAFQKVLLKRLLSDAHPGGVILLHDGIKDTMAVLPEFIHRLRAQGYEVGSVTEMMLADQAVPKLPLLSPTSISAHPNPVAPPVSSTSIPVPSDSVVPHQLGTTVPEKNGGD